MPRHKKEQASDCCFVFWDRQSGTISLNLGPTLHLWWCADLQHAIERSYFFLEWLCKVKHWLRDNLILLIHCAVCSELVATILKSRSQISLPAQLIGWISWKRPRNGQVIIPKKKIIKIKRDIQYVS